MKQAGFELTRSNGKRGVSRGGAAEKLKGYTTALKSYTVRLKGYVTMLKSRVVYGSPNASTMSRTCAGVYVRVLSEATSA